MRHKCVFHCGQKPQVVWGECKPEGVKEIHGRVRVAAQVCKERVIAEFKGLRMAWSMLRLHRFELPQKINPPGSSAEGAKPPPAGSRA